MSKELVIEQEKKKSSWFRSKEKTVRSKYLGPVVAIGVAGLIAFASISYFNKNYIYTDTVSKNIFVEGIDISGMTKEEALGAVTSKYTPQNIGLSFEENSFTISPKDIGLEYNVEAVVDNAYNYTKSESYFNNVGAVIGLINNEKQFSIKSSYDEAKLSTSIENISNEINKTMSDAKVSISSSGGISVTSAVVGKEVDVAANKEAIYEMIEKKSFGNLNLVVNKKEPNITTAQAQSVNTLLAEHTTRYTLNPVGRATNIALSAKSTSDILLMPGEEFSYNNLTGLRTKSNGYKDAGIIVNGKLEQGPGGGVCQTSTTLYNAVLFSGLKVTDTQNHSIASNYAPLGQDAMVSDGYSDLRFSNPYDHPVYIKNVIGNGTVTSRVYGNSADAKNISIKVDRFTEGGLAATKTYRQYIDSNGNIIDTEYIAKSVYKKV